MNFSGALDSLKLGSRLSRYDWGSPGIWVVLMPALDLPPFSSQEPGAKVNDRTAKHIGEDYPLHSQPYFAEYDTTTEKWQPGWLPTASDILANDWLIVLDAKT